MQVDGRCLCGAITYDAVIDPQRCAICHCSDCQLNSGTAFGTIVQVQDRQFHLRSGRLKVYEKIADSGRTRHLSFCPDCGTRLHAQTPSEPDGFFGLRVGTITQRAALRPRRQVWCGSALPWVFDLTDIPRKAAQ
ncbi:MAG: GFA family protein [Gymnodinialimonas sp.]